MRRLGHRLGLASWAGEEAASARYLDRLIPLFDRLDSSESFVRPDRNAVTWATRKRSERAAMAGIEAILAEIWAERKTKPPVGDFLDQTYDLAPGVLVTTLLSNTNTTAGPDLDHFDPACSTTTTSRRPFRRSARDPAGSVASPVP